MAAALLVGLIAAPLASAVLFLPGAARRHVGRWHAVRRFLNALIGTVLLAGVATGVVWLLRVPHREAAIGGALLVLASLVWLPATRQWSGRAHLAWASNVYLFAAYLAYILWWTVVSRLGPVSTVGGLLLWVLELFASVLACAYLWELCTALGTEHWRRRVTPDTPVGTARPFVSLHVPAHNEPPEMVIETLTSLTRLDYPAYEVIAIDDNTEDEETWRPVEAWCAAHGVKFVHLADWPGYKSGALNYALNQLTDPRAEVVGVVDSDYQLAPGFLARCAPLFADERVGFVQAPQDYRDWRQDPYYRRLFFSYRYFFAVSQPARNERDGAIFAGTMGLIRRSALAALGGWDEWCITEDAELSLRLLRAGWTGLHVDESFGYGVMPLTFEALKSQRYRWCFGGIQILRMHWRSMLPGKAGGRLSAGQRWAYLSGALQWYGDLLGLVFFAFLLAGAANLALGGEQLFRKLTVYLIGAVPALVALGLIRAVALMRRGTGASWRDAIGAFFIWQSSSLAVARASVQGLFAKRAAFLRTPKTGEQAARWRAFTANWAETLLFGLGLAGMAAALTRTDTFSGPLLAILLVVPTLGFLAAPLNSMAAQRAALPPELLARRRSEWLRERRAILGGATAGVGAAALAVAGVVLALLLAPSPHFVPPHLVRPANPQPSSTVPAGRPSTGTPGGTPPTPAPTPSTGGSTGATPTGPVGSSAPTTGGPTTGPTTPPPTVASS